jgi:hypothetical protein
MKLSISQRYTYYCDTDSAAGFAIGGRGMFGGKF